MSFFSINTAAPYIEHYNPGGQNKGNLLSTEQHEYKCLAFLRRYFISGTEEYTNGVRLRLKMQHQLGIFMKQLKHIHLTEIIQRIDSLIK